MYLPQKIKKIIGAEAFKIDSIGKSDSSVLIFDDKVLKIQDISDKSKNEHIMLCWLQGKLPVPDVLAYEEEEGKSYLLMNKVQGKMACDEEYMQNPTKQAKLLAEGLKQLWSVDIFNCPSDMTLEHKLKEAAYRVEYGLVDMNDWEPETTEKYGFNSPKELLYWLEKNQPKKELVFSHGDFCLPNIIFDNDRISGYIDLVWGGIGDKYCDIALCYRSLKSNFSGVYGKAYTGFDEKLFFYSLGIEPDFEKIEYYILLDELF